MNGHSLFLHWTWEKAPDINISSEAAVSVGFPKIFGHQWFANLSPVCAHTLNIHIKELIHIALAANIWGATWECKRVSFRCDNMAVVICVQNGTCRVRHLAFLLRELPILAIMCDWTFTAIHILVAKNVRGDVYEL